MSTPYCDLDDVKATALVDIGTNDDGLITVLCDYATALINQVSHRTFAATDTDTVKVFDGDGTRRLFLPLGHEVAALTQVRLRDNAQGAWRTATLGDVVLMPAPRRDGEPARWLEFADVCAGNDTVFPKGTQTVEATGTFGYAAVPTGVQSTAVQLVVAMYRAKMNNVDVASGELAGSPPPRWLAALARSLLSDYIRPLMV